MKTHKENTPIFGFRPAGEIDFIEMQKEIRGALARGYCSRENENKVLDSELIEAMALEVDKVITQVTENVGAELLRRHAQVKREIQNKEGVNIDDWSETGKVAYYYVDNSINIIRDVTGVKTN